MSNKKREKIAARLVELEAMEATLLPEEKAEMQDLKKRLEEIDSKNQENIGKNDIVILKGNVWHGGKHYLAGTEVQKNSAAYKVFQGINLVD